MKNSLIIWKKLTMEKRRNMNLRWLFHKSSRVNIMVGAGLIFLWVSHHRPGGQCEMRYES